MAVPGARVKVRFAGQEVGGYLLGRGSRRPTTPAGSPRCAGWSAPSRCSSPAVAALAGDLASRYAGTRSDVLRLAVPPRHAATERAEPAPGREPGAVRRRRGRRARGPSTRRPGPSCAASRRAESPRAVWATPPGADWPPLLAHAAAATYAGSGRGVAALRARRQGRRPRRPRADRRAGGGPPRQPDRRSRARRGATATSWPSPAAPGGSWSAPARPPSRRCTTWAWS